jgi:carboxypeptidase Q
MRFSRFPFIIPAIRIPGPLRRGLATGCVLVVLSIASIAWAQAPVAAPQPVASNSEAVALDQRIIAEAKNGSELMTNLGYLSDIIGPRLTGSAALRRANEWAAEKMKSYGLTNVHLEAWSIPMGWERGSATARIIEPNNGRTLTVAAMGWTPGTHGKIEGDVVVMTAKNPNELAAFKGKLKNAVVLRGPPATVRPITELGTPGGRPGQTRQGGTPGQGQRPDRGGFEQMMSFRREMMDFLRTEGAAVILQDAGKPQGLLTMGGGWRGMDRPDAADPIPALFVAHEHYALLHRLATRPAPARTRLEIEVTNKLIPGPIAVYNTIGEIKGSEKPDEYVVLGAHLDSWDLGQGTTDNGTGTAVVLETARILSQCGKPPKRTIRFALFTGEEQGLYGSKAYVQQHKDELPRISMCVVHDTGTGKVVGLGLQGREVLKPVLEAELTSLQDLGFKEISLRGMGGSDHSSFEQVGVPGFAVQQEMPEYRFTHHSQSDTFDKAQEPNLIQGAQVMAVTAMRVANLPALLSRDKPNREKK